MAKRYCGDVVANVKITDDGGTRAAYHVTLSVGGRNVSRVEIGGAASERRAIDSADVYDEVARSAISFAVDSGDVSEGDLGYEAAGTYAVSRKAVR